MSKYVFGPVPSRRLGRSLGIDLVPFKTCSYDCLYCQLGQTTCKTIERREWVPLDEVLTALEGRLSTRPDYITLSGSGEPTLFSRIGELIDRIKTMTDIPVAVLTNGSLLWQEEVREGLAHADLVMPSLDAGGESMFRLVNRPHQGISFAQMLAGLIAFGRDFGGEYWLEVFLLAAYTCFEDELAKLRQCVDLIKPDRVQLNTVTRPPAESYATAVSQERLADIARMFQPRAEVIAGFRGSLPGLPSQEAPEVSADRAQILEMLRRRPCSIGEIADGLRMHRTEVIKQVEALTAEGLLVRERAEPEAYYRAARPSPK